MAFSYQQPSFTFDRIFGFLKFWLDNQLFALYSLTVLNTSAAGSVIAHLKNIFNLITSLLQSVYPGGSVNCKVFYCFQFRTSLTLWKESMHQFKYGVALF